MIELSSVLYELLFDRDAVIIPGLGMFVRHRDGARVNVITNHFERPTATVSFDPRQREDNDLLANAVVASEGCTLEEARQTVARFVSDCFEAFKQGREMALPGIGTLALDADGALTFEQEHDTNFNGEAFGLGDFTPTPVHDSSATNDWRAQVIKQNKDKNTPMTVDRKAMDDEENGEVAFRRRRRRAMWLSILSLLLLVPAVLLLLHFMEVISLDFLFRLKPAPSVTPVASYVPRDTSLSAYYVRYEPIPAQVAPDTAAAVESQIPEEPLEETTELVEELTKPVEETVNGSAEERPQTAEVASPMRYSIIGGCFSQKENAENLAASLLEQGYVHASVMPRGRQYYVCYARFATLEEAKAELEQVRANSNNKAWILDK